MRPPNFSNAGFLGDCRGSLREITTAVAALIAVAGVAATMGLDHMTRDGSLPRLVVLTGKSSGLADKLAALGAGRGSSGPVAGVGIDETPTGSIPAKLSQPVIINPCTGATSSSNN